MHSHARGEDGCGAGARTGPAKPDPSPHSTPTLLSSHLGPQSTVWRRHCGGVCHGGRRTAPRLAAWVVVGLVLGIVPTGVALAQRSTRLLLCVPRQGPRHEAMLVPPNVPAPVDVARLLAAHVLLGFSMQRFDAAGYRYAGRNKWPARCRH